MEPVTPQPPPAETIMDYSMLGGAHAQRGRKLFRTGLGLLAAALAYLAYRADLDDIVHLYLGLIIFALAAVPALLWARDGGSRFPVFETILILTANAYALPVLNRHEQLANYTPEVITRASLAVIIYQLTAILTYQFVKGQPGRSRFWRESLITTNVEKFVVYGLIASTAYICISTFTSWVPTDLESILRAIFYGIGILCTFVSTQRWGRGELTRTEKIVLICTLGPQLIVMCIGLILIGSISLIGIALLGYLAGGKRIPWIFFATAFAVLAVLHTGKSQMREKYWEQKLPQPTVTQLPAYFAEWVGYGLQPTGGKTASQKMLERTSLMHILCLIIDYTPARQDYLHGKTYGYVLPQLIPRFFWPEKPRSHIATYELAIYYGLQDEQATTTTTIAFGLLTEAYANFGLVGAFLLGLFWGFWLKKLQLWSSCSPMFSFAGLLMVLLTAWAFSSELTMAAWVSSLEQAIIVVLGVPLLLRSLFGS